MARTPSARVGSMGSRWTRLNSALETRYASAARSAFSLALITSSPRVGIGVHLPTRTRLRRRIIPGWLDFLSVLGCLTFTSYGPPRIVRRVRPTARPVSERLVEMHDLCKRLAKALKEGDREFYAHIMTECK